MPNLQSIEDKTDDLRKRTATKLESAADTINEIADNASKKLDSTASFVRGNCARSKVRMLGGFRNSVRRNPMKSLALATAIGVVAGFTCRPSR